jgi:hypothetical protein
MYGTDVLKSITRFIKSNFFLLLLISIVTIVAVLNYTPSLWLSGWDTLHPEFDFALNLKRMIFGAWRDDQGLGSVAAHAHMSDLPRILSMIVIWLFVPLKSIKMVYVMICLILGPIGAFFFIRELLSKKSGKYSFEASSAAFLGGLLYLFNLGTVQHFYVVFEMFAVQYAAIGWLFYLAHKYLKTKSNKTLFAFFIVSFLATPMAYASLLWFAYIAGLGLYIFSYLFTSKNIQESFFRGISIGLVSLAANLFWLLPNLYLLFSGASKIPQNSHINSLFSEEAFLHNQAFGSIKNIALLKNFLFNWSNYDFATGEHTYLLNTWSSHLEKPEVLLIGYSVAAVITTGLCVSIFKKQKHVFSLIPSFVFALLMLINANGIMEVPFNWLRDNSNLFNEALRFPFTKFSILLALTAVVFFANFMFHAISYLSQKSKIITIVFVTVMSGSLAWYSAPMLQGEVISDLMIHEIPREYFDFYTWADKQPSNARMALFPVYSYAGWEYHEWGYEGPGFNWFALKQPVLTRDFDRWNPGNEAFYNQVSNALYQENNLAFENVFSQYDVSFVVIDESIIVPKKDSNILKYEKTKELLLSSGAKLVWSGDFISVYDVSDKNNLDNDSFVSSSSNAVKAYLSEEYLEYDPIYNNHSSYLSSKGAVQLDEIEYPFVSFTKALLPRKIRYTTTKEGFVLAEYQQEYDSNQEKKVSLPNFEKGKTYSFPVSLKKNQKEITLLIYFPYQVYSDGNPLITNQYLEKKINLTTDYENISVIVNDNPFEVSDGVFPVTGMVDITIGVDSPIILYGKNTSDKVNVIPQLLEQDINLKDEIIKYTESQVTQVNEKTISFSELKFEFLTKEQTIDISDSGFEINCDRFQSGEIFKEFTQNETIYSAEKLGAICDAILIGKLNSDYIVRVVGNGISGRGSKLMVNSWSPEKPKLEELLPQDEFDLSFGITLNHEEKIGQSLGLETRSFGDKKSVNSIKTIAYYDAPLSLLYNVSLLPKEDNFILGANIKSTKQIGNSFYKVETSNNETKNFADEFIYLSQSYDNGWVAFAKNEKSIFGSKLEHLEFNGWANAWIIPNKNSEITIIFWPQLLQFLGFAVLIISGIYLWVYSIKKKH